MRLRAAWGLADSACGRVGASGILLLAMLAASLSGQDLETTLQPTRDHVISVFGEVKDAGERQALVALYKLRKPGERTEAAERFLSTYPQSDFLADVDELAAKAYVDEGDIQRALFHARRSLKIMPENPLLLVTMANAADAAGVTEGARQFATRALFYLPIVAGPSSISKRDWPAIQQEMQASCLVIVARGSLASALAAQLGKVRTDLLSTVRSNLRLALSLDSGDEAARYLLGIDELTLGNREASAGAFLRVAKSNGRLAPLATGKLKELYRLSKVDKTFDDFVKRTQEMPDEVTPAIDVHPRPLPEYAGSQACRLCHTRISESWSHTGMARMLRPYQPENIIGDFTKNNVIRAGEQDEWRDGRLLLQPGTGAPVARMLVDKERHYFQMKEQNGEWRRYSVDYTIGSKWEQAYVTRLPNGELHVFPLQYNVRLHEWVNFWKVLDPPGSPRADLLRWGKFDIWTNYEANCAACHTSQLRNLKGGGFEAGRLKFREPGVDCEMCHGPSQKHVNAMRTGKPYEKMPLEPPVDFEKISSRQFLKVCSQCHMQSAIRNPGPHGELNYSREGDFVPTYLRRPLTEFSRKGFYKDGRFRQTTFIVEAFSRSQCFQTGNATCASCHEVHTRDPASNPVSLRYPTEPDRMCLRCHSGYQSPEEQARHVRHAASAKSVKCVDCHMPRITEALLFRARSHRIDDIPDPEMTARFGREESPNACLLCHQSTASAMQLFTEWSRR
jgi:tetratricopeptide (TPR) repeat protein